MRTVQWADPVWTMPAADASAHLQARETEKARDTPSTTGKHVEEIGRAHV